MSLDFENVRTVVSFVIGTVAVLDVHQPQMRLSARLRQSVSHDAGASNFFPYVCHLANCGTSQRIPRDTFGFRKPGTALNTDLLDAVDTVYLRAFHQNLRDDLLRACVSLKQYLRQSMSLAEAQELPEAFRKNYRKIAEGLPPLISSLRGMLRETENRTVRPIDGEPATFHDVAEAIAMLDATETEILNILNGVGNSLVALPPSIVSWDGNARLRTRTTLQHVAERPCYDLDAPIDICVYPFLIADYTAQQTQAISGRWPNYLVDEIMPVALLPWLKGIHIEVELCGQAYASCRPQRPREA